MPQVFREVYHSKTSAEEIIRYQSTSKGFWGMVVEPITMIMLSTKCAELWVF